MHTTITDPISLDNAVLTDDTDGLMTIHRSDKNIAIYRRSVSHLTPELRKLKEVDVSFQSKGTHDDVMHTLKGYIDGVQASPAFLQDISGLIQVFLNITASEEVKLMLKTIDNDMCRKFHTDVNDLRLLCTYDGPGTLWIPDACLQNVRIEDHECIERTPEIRDNIQQTATGDVIILKGALYPDANPILHRSPAITEDGQRRLLLRLDSSEFLNFWT